MNTTDKPEMHVLYRFWGKNDELLYVGITNNFYNRINGHSQTSQWLHLAERATFEHYGSREELIEIEKFVIRSEHPTYNRQYSVNKDKLHEHFEWLISGESDDAHRELKSVISSHYKEAILFDPHSLYAKAWAVLNGFDEINGDNENEIIIPFCKICQNMVYWGWLQEAHGEMCDIFNFGQVKERNK